MNHPFSLKKKSSREFVPYDLSHEFKLAEIEGKHPQDFYACPLTKTARRITPCDQSSRVKTTKDSYKGLVKYDLK